MYTFSSNKSPSNFIGKELIPEKIEEIKSKFASIKIEDEDPLTEDYIFCPYCEKRFSVIETYFAQNVIQNFEKNKIFKSDTRTTVVTRKSNSTLIRLFTFSLFWRLSISKGWSNFKMDPPDEEKLRYWLDSLMALDLDQTAQNTEKIKEILDLPITVAVMEEFGDPTSSFISPNVFSTKPYMLIADQFVFFLYMQKGDLRRPTNYFYGLSEFIKDKTVVNTNEDSINYLKIFEPERKVIQNNLVSNMVLLYTKNYISEFNYCHRYVFGIRPSDDTISFLKNYFNLHGVNINDSQKMELFSQGLLFAFNNFRVR